MIELVYDLASFNKACLLIVEFGTEQ